MLSMLLAAALCPQGPGTSTAPVVINEFCYDDSGTDDFEFVELYNRSTVPVDISGWSIINKDTGSLPWGTGGTDPQYFVPPNTILPPGGFYLFANVAITPPNPAMSQVLPLNAIENGPAESIELLDANNVTIDEVAYEIGGNGPFGPHPMEANGFYGDLSVGNGTGLPAASHGRYLDGWDNNDNARDFGLCNAPTPGLTNNTPSALPWVNNFDTGNTGLPVTGWVGGWVNPEYVDPTVASAQNLTAKPASPQGGLGMSTWDRTGGGNTVQLDGVAVADVVVDTYAWFEPIMAPYNPALYSPSVPPVMLNNYNYADGEWWALGARGSCQANGNPPDVGGYFAAINPGVGTRYHTVTGIAWAHFRTPYASQLYLIDFGNGPDPLTGMNYTVLAGPIDILQGINDGWQRLRLHLEGDRVYANFGGTPGYDDGLRFTASGVYNSPGAVYIAYREALLYNSNGTAGCHPPVFDAFDVHVSSATISYFGSGSPTTVGTPGIAPMGLPILGSSAFGVAGSSLVPAGAPNQGVCVLFLGFTAIPTGFPIPGAPATAMGYLINDASLLSFANAAGASTWALPIPAINALNGLTLNSQLLDYDSALPATLPIGMSQAMTFQVGR